MAHRRLSAFVLLVVLLTGSTGASGCAAQRREARTTKPTPPAPTQPTPILQRDGPLMTDDTLKDLAAGSYGSLRESFVFVARDAQTYEALRALVRDLPAQPADFFKANAVVAAFLGQRRSGGYSVEIKREGRKRLSLVEHGPPKGAMTTMALTTPFRVVAVPTGADEALALGFDATWQQRLRPYRITDGELLVSGGFAGIKERARLEGRVGVMRAGEMATLVFDVRSVGGNRQRTLSDTATGRVDASGSITLARVDAFALSGAIESPLRMTGQMTAGEQRLTLSFETVAAPHVADNFSAQGQLTADAEAPAPASKATTDDPT